MMKNRFAARRKALVAELTERRKTLLAEADAIVLEGGRLLPNDRLVRAIEALSRKIRFLK